MTPFSLVYDTLWKMMIADERFTVKSGNRLDFNTNDRSAPKSQMSTADYPEVMLVAEGCSGNLCNTSSTSMITRRFSWVVSTGDFRYNQLFPVEWAIFAGMLAWRYELGSLLWNGNPFVTRANLVEANTDQIDKQRRRGIEGWIAVWTIEVEMHFANVLILGSHIEG